MQIALPLSTDRSSGPKFVRYWASPTLQPIVQQLKAELRSIQPSLIASNAFGEASTIHIGSSDEVLKSFGSDIYFISRKYLSDLCTSRSSSFNLTPDSRQMASPCLNGMKFAITGFDKQMFTEIASQILLLGGTIQSISDISSANYLVSFSALSPLIDTAKQQCIPVVSSIFVSSCLEYEALLSPSDFPIPQFYNLCLTSSDLDHQTSEQLRSIIVRGGGQWKSSLDDSVSAIVAEGISMTKKIQIALMSSVWILPPRWVFEEGSAQRLVLNPWCFGLPTPQIFKGMTFCIDNKSQDADLIAEAVKFSGGTVTESAEINIVPPLCPSHRPNAVTPSWVWRSISHKEALPFNSSITFSPFRFAEPPAEIIGLVIAVIGLRGREKEAVVDGLRALSAVVQFSINSKCRVIVDPQPSETEMKEAKKATAFVVSQSWAKELFESGRIPNYADHSVVPKSKQLLLQICSTIKSGYGRRSGESSGIITTDQVMNFSDDEEKREDKQQVTIEKEDDNEESPRSGTRDYLMEALLNERK